jgi:hypothetical protein
MDVAQCRREKVMARLEEVRREKVMLIPGVEMLARSLAAPPSRKAILMAPTKPGRWPIGGQKIACCQPTKADD